MSAVRRADMGTFIEHFKLEFRVIKLTKVDNDN